MREALTLSMAFPTAEPRPVTGAVELAVAEAAAGPGPRGARVSAVLAAAFGAVDGVESDLALVRRLASGARAWLLLGAARIFGREREWFQATCDGCGRPFDFQTRPGDAPRKGAGVAFPAVEVPTSLGPLVFEVPNGLHEEALARRRGDPRRVLAGLCGLSNTAEADAERLSEADLDRIEALLDDAAPDVADTVTTRCPECDWEAELRLDPLIWAFPIVESLLGEAHRIASAYGWSEAEILALPRARRRAYAAMIARDARAPR